MRVGGGETHCADLDGDSAAGGDVAFADVAVVEVDVDGAAVVDDLEARLGGGVLVWE